MKREKYDDTIRTDSQGLARQAMMDAVADMKIKSPAIVPAERLTSTGRAIETRTTDAAPSPSEPK